MAIKKKITYTCDLCDNEFPEEMYWDRKDIMTKPKNTQIQRYIGFPVIFLTEQTEGRSCKPYVDTVNLDICNACAMRSLNIQAIGAQGYNQFKFKK